MKVLLSNHHLADRAGSELYVSELSSALVERGHEVRVFTLMPGVMAENLRASGVLVHAPGDREALLDFAPDVVHTHHPPTLWLLAGYGLDGPFITSSLGVLHPLETAPPVWDGVACMVGVSPEVCDRLAESPAARSLPVHVMPNWFDDRDVDLGRTRPRGGVRRIGVVTNHLDGQLRLALDLLCSNDADLTWEHLGLPERSVEVTPEVLEGYDLIVSIGRTVLLAAALTIPVLVADIHGSDGVLTPDVFDEVAKRNFSGRTYRRPPDLSELSAAVRAAEVTDLDVVRDKALAGFRLTDRAAQWEALYESVRDGHVGMGPEARTRYESLGAIYLSAIEQTVRQRDHARLLHAEREQLRSELAGRVEEVAAVLAKMDALGDALQTTTDERDDLRRRLGLPGVRYAVGVAARAGAARRAVAARLRRRSGS